MPEAAEALADEAVVVDAQVEPDWITRFFNHAEGVSSEQMQQLWGRILAGEVRKPGSVSLRTLDLLRDLSQSEAELFCRIAALAFVPNGTDALIINSDDFLATIYKISFGEILLLKELGLLHHEFGLHWSIDPKGAGHHLLEYAGHAILMQWKEPTGKIEIPVLKLTKIGSELLPLVSGKFDQAYAEKLCSLMKRPGCTFEFGPIKNRVEGGWCLIGCGLY